MDTEKLRNLHKLKEEGILNEEEFQEQKRKLLDEQPSATPSATAQPAAPLADEERQQYTMFIHLSLLIGLVFPWVGLVVPIVLWLIKKEDPVIDEHGRVVANWLISSFIYSIAGIVLSVILIGIPILLAVVICHFIFAIIGGVKAKSGELWHYPLSIKFFKV